MHFTPSLSVFPSPFILASMSVTAAMQSSQLENLLIVSDKNRGGDRERLMVKEIKKREKLDVEKENEWHINSWESGFEKKKRFRGHWFRAAGGDQDVTHLSASRGGPGSHGGLGKIRQD